MESGSTKLDHLGDVARLAGSITAPRFQEERDDLLYRSPGQRDQPDAEEYLDSPSNVEHRPSP